MYVCNDPDHPISTKSVDKWYEHQAKFPAKHRTTGRCLKCGKDTTTTYFGVKIRHEAPLRLCADCKVAYAKEIAAETAATDGGTS